jgi:hypothetical protein
LDRYDLAGGQKLSSIVLDGAPTTSQRRSLSPDGTRLAYEDEHMNVIILSAMNGVEAARWTPYAPVRVPAGGVFQPQQLLARIDFVADDRLLTINQAGDMDLWTVPGAKPIYHLAARRERQFNEPQVGLALSHDRKTVAVFNGDGFNLHNTADGRLVGKTAHVAKFKMLYSVRAAAFSADGKSLAAVMMVWSGKPAAELILLSFDVATGRFGGDFTLPAAESRETNTLAWWGSKHVFAYASIERKGQIIAFPSGPGERSVQVGYRLQSGLLAPNSPDGRLWYVVESDDAATAFLTTAELPEQELRAGPEQPETKLWLTAKGVTK